MSQLLNIFGKPVNQWAILYLCGVIKTTILIADRGGKILFPDNKARRNAYFIPDDLQH